MKKILFLIFFLIFPLSPQLLSADVVTISRTDDFTQFERYISHIVSLDKYIEKLPDVPMKYKLQSQMDVYIEEAKKISNSLSFPMRAKGTLDISDTFHFSIQKYKLSCEIAAFRMALESLGKTDITEDSIISSLKIFSQPLSTDGIWGDPDIEFVGSYTGSQYMRTGYGIYEKPLLRIARSWGYDATSGNMTDGRNITPRTRLIEHLDALKTEKRIILWGDWCTEKSAEDGILKKVSTIVVSHFLISAKNPCDRPMENRKFSWKTLSGKEVRALSGEHAFLLLGYIGSREKPTHIIVWDTDTGKHTYPYSEWMRKWSLLEYRSLTLSKKK